MTFLASRCSTGIMGKAKDTMLAHISEEQQTLHSKMVHSIRNYLSALGEYAGKMDDVVPFEKKKHKFGTRQYTPGDKESSKQYTIAQAMVSRVKNKIDEDCKGLEKKVRRLELGKPLDVLDDHVYELNHWLDMQAMGMYDASREIDRTGKMVTREDMVRRLEKAISERKVKKGMSTDTVSRRKKLRRAIAGWLRRLSDRLEM